MAADKAVRVGIYGAGSWANRTHIPNLQKLDGVEVVAVCDVGEEARQATAERFEIPGVYGDGYEMLERESLDVLYSVVPAFARTDVEARAAEKGIHLFSEKPQALEMRVALRIDEAVRKSGVASTVCFRERYRPLFQEAKRLLADKKVVHVEFRSMGGMPEVVPLENRTSWWQQMEKSGGSAFDWGVHAVDYTRFMTGLEMERAQAFYYERPEAFCRPLSSSFHFCLSNRATMTMAFVSAGGGNKQVPWFTFYVEGGRLEVFGYERIDVDGETVYKGEAFDPWFEQDRVFIEAVRSGDRSAILNDYRDGLYSLAPVLAGWASARQGGECVDVHAFMKG
ncbi:MAG: Gfo/Idh/MocA family oxidoreductase [bacterium]|nr:Gfo/Idh/MocA family oxidoreductase [bacterium]